MLVENQDGDLAKSRSGERESGRKVEDHVVTPVVSVRNGGFHLSWGRFHLQDDERTWTYLPIAERIRLESAVCARGYRDLVVAISVDPHCGEARATWHGLEPTDLDTQVRERGARARAERIAADAANKRRESSISRSGDSLVGSLTANCLTECWRQHRFTNRRQVWDAKSQVDID